MGCQDDSFRALDLGLKGKHRATVLDDAKVRGEPFTVEVSHEGFQALLQRAEEGPEGPATFVFEPTGLAWLVFAGPSACGYRQLNECLQRACS